MSIRFFSSILFVFAVAACGGAEPSPGEPSGSGSGSASGSASGSGSGSGSGAVDRVDAVSALSGDAGAGSAAFASRCAPCHGARGQGGGGPRLVGLDEGVIVSTLVRGRGGMPSFGRLADPELADLAAFVMALE